MGRISFVVALAAFASLASYGGAKAQVRGSYLRTCVEVEQRGPFLSALCRDARGRFVPSGLDVRVCSGGRVANLNGQLACESQGRRVYRDGRRYGRGYDRDYYRDGQDGYGFREDYAPAPRGYYAPY